MKIKSIFFIVLLVCSISNAKTLSNSLIHELKSSLELSFNYLISKQNYNGSWGDYNGNIAYTALSVISLTNNKVLKKKYSSQLDIAIRYIINYAKSDGSFYESSRTRKYTNYNTNLCLIALYQYDKNRFLPYIKRSREFIRKSQFGEDRKLEAGGIGYGSNKEKSDVSNTQYALEALFITKDVEDFEDYQKTNETKKVFKNALDFLKKCQAYDGNSLEWAKGVASKDKGGFIYSPDRSQVNSKKLRTYGSMTYAGFKSLIYAEVSNNDARIKSLLKWISNNYTVKKNPGLNYEGYYYYINVFAKALNAFGKDYISTKKSKHNWRKDLALEMLNKQQRDGSWVNSSAARWQENNPILVTNYVINALQNVLASNK